MLHLGSGHKQLAVVRYLVENHANVNAVNDGGRTPLDIAVPARQQAIIDFLVGNGAEHNRQPAPQRNPRFLPAQERRRHGW